MTAAALLTFAAHMIAAGAVGGLVVLAYRWVRGQSPPVGYVMALGIVARSVCGLVLFWISYLHLPVLEELHLGDGFWRLAPDARFYYWAAISFLRSGVPAASRRAASSVFVKTLADWMGMVGVSPASALFLHVSLFALLCVLVVKVARPGPTWRTALPAVVCLIPFSAAPSLLIHGTQPLKDETVVFLLAITSLMVLQVFRSDPARSTRRAGMVYLNLAVLGFATLGMATVRDYVVIIVGGGLTLAAFVFVWLSRREAIGRALTVALAGVAVVFLAYVLGGGRTSWFQALDPASPASASQMTPSNAAPAPPLPPSTMLHQAIERAAATGQSALHRVEANRAQFEQTGGGTNIVGDTPASDNHVVRATLVGLASTFLPISVVKAFGWIEFSGGRGLLFITDIDTIFLDLTIAAAFWMVFSRRHRGEIDLPYLVFSVCVAGITAVLLAYVVSNFGTLFRLRLMLAVPLWILPLTVCRTAGEKEELSAAIGT